jgi:hypothetical protein
MKRIEVLEKVKAAKVLALESNTQGAMARDATNKSVDSVNPKAVCWCSIGALENELDVTSHGMAYLCPILCTNNRGLLIEANDEKPEALEHRWDNLINEVALWALQWPEEERVLPSYCIQSFRQHMGYWNEPQADESEGYGTLKYETGYDIGGEG